MDRSEIKAIVLGAGRSSRMGITKQMLPVGGMTMLQQTISNLLNCPLSGIVVVLGHEAEKIQPLIQAYPVVVVINRDFEKGMSSSIRCAMEQLEPSCGSVLIALGDQPFIQGRIVNRLIDEYLGSDKGIAYPIHAGKRGHPIILDRKYEDEIKLLEGDIGCRQILEAHPEDHLAVEVEDERILWDIDSPADYNLLVKGSR